MENLKKQLVLASKSPRRRDILNTIGAEFIVDPATDFVEIEDPEKRAHELVEINAIGKGEELASKHTNAIIIGVDTVGAFEDHILEKPKDKDDAFRMLSMLRGNTHEVLSCIHLIDTTTGQKQTKTVSTKITFNNPSDEELWAYIKTEEPMDKAAAYGIQGIGSLFVKEIQGDYFNIVGLPVTALHEMLQKFDFNLLLS